MYMIILFCASGILEQLTMYPEMAIPCISECTGGDQVKFSVEGVIFKTTNFWGAPGTSVEQLH